MNRTRPPAVRPTAINRSSANDRLGAGAICGSLSKTASISAIETPYFWHFSQFPVSQSKPDAKCNHRCYVSAIATVTYGARAQTEPELADIAGRNRRSDLT
jgi:hypothetical protein